LLGADVDDIPRVRDLIRQAGFLGWRNAFVEAAFWDASAKRKGVPVYKLIEPSASTVHEVDVYWSTGEARAPKAREHTLLEAKGKGFHGLKLRVHDVDPKVDEEAVRHARFVLGPGFPLMVDANQGWVVSILDEPPRWDRDRALAFTRVCAECDVKWLEEPLDQHDYDGQAWLRAESDVDIAGAELNAGWPEFAVMLEKDCFDVYQPDCTLAGGITDCARLARAAHRKGRAFTPHTWTNGIGFLMNLHLKAAFPSDIPLEYPLEPPGWVPHARDGVLSSTIDVTAQGTVKVPNEPGLGVHLSRTALARFGSRFYKGNKLQVAISTIRSKGWRTALDLSRRKKNADEARRARAERALAPATGEGERG
jgi:L-alanine-DL-glutamate epimerase-like enolase superfamily enzyme